MQLTSKGQADEPLAGRWVGGAQRVVLRTVLGGSWSRLSLSLGLRRRVSNAPRTVEAFCDDSRSLAEGFRCLALDLWQLIRVSLEVASIAPSPPASQGHQEVTESLCVSSRCGFSDEDGADDRHDESDRLPGPVHSEDSTDPASEDAADDAEHDREDHATWGPDPA
jgi:hypothetical protein